MPITWDVAGLLTCDIDGCGRRLGVAGETQKEALRWVKAAHWTYRWSTMTGERRLIVRCPDHPERYDETEAR